MVFNPVTQQLFTDQGQFIKQLHCPLNVLWSELNPIQKSRKKLCEHCSRAIIKTDALIDEALLSLVTKDPDTCLQLEFDQENLLIDPFAKK
jgi:hypothetical protein